MKLSEKTLRQTIARSKKPVLVVFSAEWCRPCIETLKNLRAQTVRTMPRIIDIDIERHPEIGNAFGIINLPTLMLYINGRRANTHIGAICSHKALSLFDFG